ncbi:MAG: hypothetical protein II625_11055 [Bacilli bacterium]|nr:hypothetical protein [Bacilli bacterium]
MEKRVSEYAEHVLSYLNRKITEEEFQTIATMDIATIVKEYNKGNVDVLNRPDVQIFMNSTITIRELIFYMKECQNLLAYKKDILDLIERQKSEFRYDPNTRFFKGDSYGYYSKVTYQQVLEAIEIAEKTLNGKEFYLLLKALLKFESIRPELKERKEVLTAVQKPDERRDLLQEIIDRADPNMGIIQISEYKKGDRFVAGTKKDMAISEIIGVPYPADADKEGYDYGPHGDYYMPPCKVEKTFHQPETKTHFEMIRTEVQKRKDALFAATDEQGYIYKNGVALLITSRELAECGVDPVSVGWKPIKVTPKHQSILSLRDERGFRLPLKETIAIKAKTL